VDRSCLLISVFKQQSNDKKFIIEVCCFLCELQLMSPIVEIVVMTRLVRQYGLQYVVLVRQHTFKQS